MKSVKLYGLLLGVAAMLPCASAAVIQLDQSFDDISTLSSAGWTIVNNSAPTGTTSWFQGDSALLTSQSGDPNSYIAANFNAASYGGNVSLWLITPEVTLINGDTISFYTISTGYAPDSLELRYSTDGASSDVGSSSSSFGDFSNLLLAINPAPVTATGYPTGWTLETATISGLLAPVTGRIAFHYLVTDTSVNGDFIGIDTVSAATPEPASMALSLFGLAALVSVARSRRKRNNQ
jgi:hypothetical protein